MRGFLSPTRTQRLKLPPLPLSPTEKPQLFFVWKNRATRNQVGLLLVYASWPGPLYTILVSLAGGIPAATEWCGGYSRNETQRRDEFAAPAVNNRRVDFYSNLFFHRSPTCAIPLTPRMVLIDSPIPPPLPVMRGENSSILKQQPVT